MTSTPCAGDGELWLSDLAADRHEAMRKCAPCEELAQCLMGAIGRREMFGVWGGRDFSHAATRPQLPPAPEKPIKHGTVGGYRMHLRRKVQMCDPCRQAEQVARVRWAS